MVGMLGIAAVLATIAGPAPSTDTVNVCQLITLAEIRRVMPGAQPGKSRTIAINDKSVMNECRWSQPGSQGVTLQVITGADYPLHEDVDNELTAFGETHDPRPLKTETVAGLGDEALAVIAPPVAGSTLPGAALLFGSYRKRYFELSTDGVGKLEHDKALGALESLMRAAMGRS